MPTDAPIFSIIIAVYNAAPYLDDCLTSVLNQTFKDFEVILVDDGSTDNSLDICNRYARKDSRFFVYHKIHSGLGATRNFALQYARGKYLTALDADDMMFENCIEEKYLAMETNQCDVLFNGNVILSPDGKEFEYKKSWIYSFDHSPLLKEEFFPCIFKATNGFSTSTYSSTFFREKKLHFSDDTAIDDKTLLYAAFLEAQKVGILQKHLIKVRLSAGSLMRSAGESYLSMIKVFDKIVDLFKEKGVFEQYKRQLFTRAFQEFLFCYGRIQRALKSEFRQEVLLFCKRHQIRPFIDLDVPNEKKGSLYTLLTGNERTLLSIIYSFKKATPSVFFYVNKISSDANLESELILVELSSSKNRLFLSDQNNRVNMLQYKKMGTAQIKEIAEKSLGEYILFQTSDYSLNRNPGYALYNIFKNQKPDIILLPVIEATKKDENDLPVDLSYYLHKKQSLFSIDNIKLNGIRAILNNQMIFVIKKSFLLDYLSSRPYNRLKILSKTDKITLCNRFIFSKIGK